MLDIKDFNSVFHFDPKFSFSHNAQVQIEQHRRALGGHLFFDRLLLTLRIESMIESSSTLASQGNSSLLTTYKQRNLTHPKTTRNSANFMRPSSKTTTLPTTTNTPSSTTSPWTHTLMPPAPPPPAATAAPSNLSPPKTWHAPSSSLPNTKWRSKVYGTWINSVSSRRSTT